MRLVTTKSGQGYRDSSLVGCIVWNTTDKKSQGRYLIAAVDSKLSQNGQMSGHEDDKKGKSHGRLGAELCTLNRAIAEAKWMRSMWTELTNINYALETDKLRTLQTVITFGIDSQPAYDHLHGQSISIRDKRLAIKEWYLSNKMLTRRTSRFDANRSDAG